MFKAPKKVIGEIEKIQRRFLWGGDEEKKKMAWVKWSTVCKPKHLGGLGIKDLEVFNLALIAKWRWRLLSENDSQIWKEILKIRYGDYCFGFGDIPSNAIMRKSSLWWRDLVNLGEGLSIGRNWLNNVIKLKLGNGTRVKFWRDKWIGNESLAELFPSLMEVCDRKECNVAEMGSWTDTGWVWDRSWGAAAAVLQPEAVAAVTELLRDVQLQSRDPDRFIWFPDMIRGYTVKSCYDWVSKSLRGGDSLTADPLLEACNSLWKCDLPSKVLIFSWRLLLNRLPTRDNLHQRGVLSSPYELSCVFCFQDIESAEHMFCSCPVVRSVWRGIFSWINLDGAVEVGVLNSFQQVSSSVKGRKACRVKHLFWVATMWQVWLARNKTLFQGVVANVNSVIFSIKYASWSWFVARKGRNSGVSFSDWCNCPLGCISLL